MLILVIVLGVLAALLVAAGVTDLRARRRGHYNGVDGKAARDARRLNEAEMNMRSNGSIRDSGGGGFGGGF